MAMLSNLEYRLNYFIDAIVQPVFTTLIEILLWIAVFKGAGTQTIVGFEQNSFFAYALWAAFFGRIAASWMYEFRMVEEVYSGTVNTILVRPVSFYEYYFSQLMGYKVLTTAVSLLVPVFAVMIFDLPSQLLRLPMAILLCLYYLVLVHTMSFIISSFAFFLNKVNSITVAKNLMLWILTGEMIPLDLFPPTIKQVLLWLPFSSGTFIPVAYITGRVGIETVMQGFVSVTIGIAVAGIIGALLWRKGLAQYSGTGA